MLWLIAIRRVISTGVHRFDSEVLLLENGVLVAKVFVGTDIWPFEGLRVFAGIFVAVPWTFQLNDGLINCVQSVFRGISITLPPWIIDGILALAVLDLFLWHLVVPLTVQSPGQIEADRINRMIT